jgi:hypothetical protein
MGKKLLTIGTFVAGLGAAWGTALVFLTLFS